MPPILGAAPSRTCAWYTYARQGRRRVTPAFRMFRAMIASSRTWKSNMPAQMKSAPFSNAYWKRLLRRDRPGGHDLERDPRGSSTPFMNSTVSAGCVHQTLSSSCLPPTWNVLPLLAVRVERPVLRAVHGLHVEIGLDARLLAGDGHLEVVAPTPATSPASLMHWYAWASRSIWLFFTRTSPTLPWM